MKHSVRTFVAVEASPAVRERAARLIAEFSSAGAGVKWVEPQNLHVTLKFLGDVDAEKIPRVCEAVQQAAAGIAPFEFQLHGAGAFPNPSRPRTIWLGPAAGDKEMAELSRRIEKAVEKLGFPREGRRFQAHLTIGRVRHAGPELAELGELLRAAKDVEVGTMPVDEVVVFSSQLQPSGPIYEPLARTPLGGEAWDSGRNRGERRGERGATEEREG